MRYAFTADAKEGYLHVRVEGDNQPDVVRRYLKDVLEACLRADCPNVLIEERLVGERMALGDIFAIVSEKSESFRPAMRLVAYVDVYATGPANMKFAEDVAVNRGVSVGVFPAIPEAEAWLRKRLAEAAARRPKGTP